MSQKTLDPVASKKLDDLPEGIRSKVLGLAWRKKAPYDLNTAPIDGWGWDGNKIAAKGLTVSDFLHEVSHYLVCSEDRRTVEDFGLGMGPGSGKRASRKVTADESQQEEERASVLGIALEYSLGISPEWTLNFHNWGNVDTNDETAGTVKFYRALDELKRRKIVSIKLAKELKSYLRDWWKEAEEHIRLQNRYLRRVGP